MNNIIKNEILSAQIMSNEGLIKLVENYNFNTVLDIGSGEGIHANYLRKVGKIVDTIDFGNSFYSSKSKDEITYIGNFIEINFEKKYDCVFCSHILEHSLNIHLFLKKIHTLLNDNGVLLISVPPVRDKLVGGHVNQFTKGSMILHLIHSGFDCSEISYHTYGYNQTFILKKNDINIDKFKLVMDTDDLYTLKDFFPNALKKKLKESEYKGVFLHRHKTLNW